MSGAVDHAAEHAVLAVMLADGEARRLALAALAPDAFSVTPYRHAFAALAACEARGVAPDPLLLAAELRRTETYDAAGGAEFLDELALIAAEIPTVNAGHYVGIVGQLAARRRLCRTLRDAADDALAPDADPQQVAAAVVAAVLPVAAPPAAGPNGGGFVPANALVWDAMEEIERRSRGESTATISTGIPEIDAAAGGIERGDLATLVMVSGHGKTAVQLAMARYAAESGHAVGIVSAEMASRQLTWRLLSGMTGIPFWRLRAGQVGDDGPTLVQAAAVLQRLPLAVDASPMPSVRDVEARLRALKARTPALALVLVDYVQLLTAPDVEGRALQLDTITNRMKAIAKELDVAVVQSAQPDAQRVERRDGAPMPELADIAWSQAIRNASDVVVTGYRPGKGTPHPDVTLEMAVKKSRASDDAAFILDWTGETMLVSSTGVRRVRREREQMQQQAAA